MVSPNTRTCVFEVDRSSVTNINDAIGLEAFSSYTIAEYTEDLKQYQGIEPVMESRGAVLFSDGKWRRLIESQAVVPAEVLRALTH